MKVFTATQIKEIEEKAINFGLDELRLMENAGSACSKKLRTIFGLDESQSKRIVILCGKGNNGGDGFVIARKLREIGLNPTVILTHSTPKSDASSEMLDRARTVGVRVLQFGTDTSRCKSEILLSDILIDCIFGIGYHGFADDYTKNIFEIVNSSNATICSIDIPSGIDCLGLNYEPEHIKANLTVTISAYKQAFLNEVLADSFGEITTVKIGIPENFFDEVKTEIEIIDNEFVSRKLPERNPHSHKGTFGHALLICGSKNMPGAAIMSCKGALRSGVGKVTVAFPNKAYCALTSHLVEPLFLPLADDDKGFLSALAIPDITSELRGKSATLIGCGMGTNAGAKSVLQEVLKNSTSPVVIDADGINILSASIDFIKECKAKVILTPHIGEMSKLTGYSKDYILDNTLSVAKEFALKHSVVVVLKCHRTVITDGEKLFINTTGNSGLAQAGTGDVLSGLITSFLAQGLNPIHATCCAVYLHGRSGDICEQELGARGMLTTDVINTIPQALLEVDV